jgi:hypothetical protein
MTNLTAHVYRKPAGSFAVAYDPQFCARLVHVGPQNTPSQCCREPEQQLGGWGWCDRCAGEVGKLMRNGGQRNGTD